MPPKKKVVAGSSFRPGTFGKIPGTVGKTGLFPKQIVKRAVRQAARAGDPTVISALRETSGPAFDNALRALTGKKHGAITAADRARFRKIRGRVKKKVRAGAAAGEERPTAGEYAEADTATTSYLRAQGKAYALGRAGAAGYRAGATAKPRKEKEEEEGKGKKRRKKKGMLKTKKGGPKFSVTKKGVVRPSGRPKRRTY